MITSPSQIERAITCPRQWWYRHVLRLPEEPDPKRDWGIEGHRQIEAYLRTGERPTRSDVLRALPMIPAPGEGLLLEDKAWSEIAGVPLVAKLDLVSFRGDNVGGDSLEPDGLVEVIDWKFASTDRYALGPGDLPGNVQMAIYGRLVMDRFQVERARISLGYVFARPQSIRKVSRVVTREDLAPTWALAEATVTRCRGWASITDEEQVPGDARACDQYGGCDYRDRCSVARFDPLKQILGEQMSVDFLSKLKNKSAATAATSPAVPDLATEAAALAAEERRRALPPRVLEACSFFESHAGGRPKLSGAAAQAWAAYTRAVYDPRAVLEGTGELGAIDGVISETSHLIEVAQQLGHAFAGDAQIAAQQTPESISPPDAPASDPAAHVAAAEEKAAKKRGRAKIPVVATEPETTFADIDVVHGFAAMLPGGDGGLWVQHSPQAPVRLPIETSYTPGNEIIVAVNALTVGRAALDLRPWIDSRLVEAAASLGLATDPRAETEGRAAFGRWRLVVETYAREVALAPGLYQLDCRAGDEVAEACLRALAGRGVLVIRGAS